jgi:SAM-dependent methyltransferase
MERCRACGHKLGGAFLSLGSSPLSNSYLTPQMLSAMEPFYPLDVFVCEKCFLVQLDEFEKAQNIFDSEYAYFSSYSDSWLEHCRAYVDMMMKRFAIDKTWFVVELASNDGYLLQYFKKLGIPLLGIEPAENTANEARKKGISTDVAYFTEQYAQKLAQAGKAADLIIANNVLAHNPDINDFTAGIAALLKPEGIVTVEVPHLLTMLSNNEFDTIYHEHYSYLSLFSVQKLFESHGLTVFDVEEIPTHGGSLRVYAKPAAAASAKNKVADSVERVIAKEKAAGLFSINTYGRFRADVEKVKRELLLFLIEQKKAGKTVVGYGAPAKGNTLLNYCGIRTDLLEYTVDRSPHKQGKFLPGTHIPVFGPDKIRETKPDYVLILPWNIQGEIMQQMAHIRDWGGKFAVAIPEMKVFE